MNTKEININGNAYVFANETKYNRIGFVQITKLYINGNFRAISTKHHIGKDGNPCTFKPSMLGTIWGLLQEEEARERKHFLTAYNYTKMTPRRAKEFREYLGYCPHYKELESVYNTINK